MRAKAFGIALFLFSLLLASYKSDAQQQVNKYADSLVIHNQGTSVSVNYKTGCISYHFSSGIALSNTIAYINDISSGYLSTADCKLHKAAIDTIGNTVGRGIRLVVKHTGNDKGIA